MQLKPGTRAEYKKRHDKIWPELVELLKKNGISEYSIFLDHETNTLFAFQKNEDSVGSQSIGNETIVQKWWAYMADISVTNEDNSPISSSLEELFYLD